MSMLYEWVSSLSIIKLYGVGYPNIPVELAIIDAAAVDQTVEASTY